MLLQCVERRDEKKKEQRRGEWRFFPTKGQHVQVTKAWKSPRHVSAQQIFWYGYVA